MSPPLHASAPPSLPARPPPRGRRPAAGPGRLLAVLGPLVALLGVAPEARAHALSLAQANAQFSSNAAFVVRIDFDVVAMMADVPPSALRDSQVQSLAAAPSAQFRAALAGAHERLRGEFKVLTQDGTELPPTSVILPDERAVLQAIRDSLASRSQPSNFIGELRGEIPPSAREVRLQFPEVMGAVAVRMNAPGKASFDALHLPGEIGPPFEVGEIRAAVPPPPMSRRQVLVRYLLLGFTHILPKGADHILFVLGLFLLSTRFRPLFWQITAFTLAHSITLALAMYGVFTLPSSVVEPLIALSISFVAIENVFSSRLHVWRPFVVFGFGLVHGLGFASVLLELGLPRQEFGAALVAFNLGVEAGQLSVIAGAALLAGWFFRKPWYRSFITIPLSCIIAVIGLLWACQRMFG